MFRTITFDIKTFVISEIDLGITKTPRGAFIYENTNGSVKYIPKENVNGYVVTFVNGNYIMLFEDLEYDSTLVNNGFLDTIIKAKEVSILWEIEDFKYKESMHIKRMQEINKKIDYFRNNLK